MHQEKMPEERRTGPLLDLMRRSSIRRVLLLVLVCFVSALLLMERTSLPGQEYQVGDVASHDLRAPASFTYVDTELTAERRRKADESVPAVYDFDATLTNRLQNRISLAFDSARRKLAEATLSARGQGLDEPSSEELALIQNDFMRALEFSIHQDHLESLMKSGFDEQTESLVIELLGFSMRRYIIADRSLLPSPPRPISVIRLLTDSRQEISLDDYEQIVTPEEVRQEIALYVLEHEKRVTRADTAQAANAIARAAVRPNFSYNQLLTQERRRESRNSIPEVVHHVKKGTILFRGGDVIEARHIDMVQAFLDAHGRTSRAGVLLSLLAFCTLVVVTFYMFATGYIRKFTNETRNLEAIGFILLICLALARAVVEASSSIFSSGGDGPLPSSFLYILPIAGGAMLVRILANNETALLFSLVASLLTGVMMDQQVLFALFFLLSCVTAAGSITNTHERLHVLRAGLQTSVVNGAVVLILDMMKVYQGIEASAALSTALWDVLFAVLGGMISAVMVLGLVPFFELFGFITDYKLLELTNLNHPLLRQLMLRAPGTYHHSVIVGSLAEAACERIGANALLARVAAYFHDIGKAVKPQYFVENQRDIPNPHDRLGPRQSAAILIGHVRDGQALAREHHLPQPIIDNIAMHHGTGVISYFHDKACKLAGPGTDVPIAAFRYPGPRPDTREAGILHLADKVEAASRVLERPDPEGIRKVIQKIVNGVMMDGQFEKCPLTLKELYAIANSFSEVLMGIYHQRIEYPGERRAGSGSPLSADSQQSVITLELHNPLSGSDNGEETSEEPESALLAESPSGIDDGTRDHGPAKPAGKKDLSKDLGSEIVDPAHDLPDDQ